MTTAAIALNVALAGGMSGVVAAAMALVPNLERIRARRVRREPAAPAPRAEPASTAAWNRAA